MICRYEKTIYKNEETGFGIYQFMTQDTTVPKEAQFKKGSLSKIYFVGKGYLVPEAKEAELDLSGEWIKSKYGIQMEITRCIQQMPKTKEGMIGYLSSGLIKGVGKTLAERIVAKFGLETFQVIESKSEELLSVPGITEKKLKGIQDSFNKSKDLQEIMTQLSPFGISVNKAIKIQEMFQGKALEIVTKDTYRLCEIAGLGFLTVDKIAHSMGCPLDSPLRIHGAVYYVLQQATEQGHLYLPANELVKNVVKVLNSEQTCVSILDVQNQVRFLSQNNRIIADKGCVYLPHHYLQEAAAARAISNLLLSRKKEILDLDSWLEKAQSALHIILSETQKKAVKMSLTHMVSIITGGPGTGKTTILKVILYIYQKTEKGDLLLVAPTGRASRQMAESTGFHGASTIHKALGLTSESRQQEEVADINSDFIILDETSMADMYVSSQLFSRIKKGARLLLVGDIDQLPSVGAGNVFRELIESNLIPVTFLDAVYRQSEKSLIALNALKVKDGITKLDFGEDFSMREIAEEETAMELVIQNFQKEVARFGIDNVQILCPMKKRGKVSVNELNLKIQSIVNPPARTKPEMKVGNKVYRLYDKIIHLKNTEDLSNGDIGKIIAIDLENKECMLSFSDDRKVCYSQLEMERVALAYALTIHKSQGSECSSVIIPLMTSAYIMLKRNLIYTAITRGKQNVIIIGQQEAVAMAIQKNDVDKRYTNLGKRLRQCYSDQLKALKDLEERMKPIEKKQLSLQNCHKDRAI